MIPAGLNMKKDEGENRQATWWKAIAENERLCHTIADYFGWPRKIIRVGSHALCIIKTGRQWVSLPHVSYGGIAITADYDELLKRAGLKGQKWLIRGSVPVSPYYRQDKTTSYLHLADAAASQFNSFTSGVRRKIRKAIRNNITVKKGGVELIEDFYSTYAVSMHELGSPALPQGYIRAMLTNYDDGKEHHASLFVAYYQDKAVGAALLISAGGVCENILFGSLRDYNRYYTTYLLHWEMINHAIERKGFVYSFGRSTNNSGVHNYKKQWGTYELPLYWSYSHPVKKSVKDLRWLAVLWRWIPYPLAKRWGPWFAARIY